jgi:hypothetical protein
MDMTLTAERRPVRTFDRDGRKVYADTGRSVDERLGSHVTLWIVEDPEAWATAIEAEGDAELAKWPKRQRDLAEYRRGQADRWTVARSGGCCAASPAAPASRCG